jgi:hypothetical protein
MIESKVFAGGGLNQDVDNNFLKSNDWKDALNIRVTDRLNNTDNIISNIKGNTSVSYTLPAGTNKCIGEYANEQTGKYYSFIWNSSGNHSITEYDPTLNTIVKVLEANFLNFQEYELINGIGIVDGNLLYWTDGFNPPRGIMIDKAKDPLIAPYYTDSLSISLIKRPPSVLITPSYANDPGYPAVPVAINRLKGQLFQFRYLYIYEDGSRSAWSSCSTVPYPTLEVNSSVSSEAFRNNNIVLNFNVGTKYVKTIEVAALVKGDVAVGATQDWFVILSKNRADLIADTGSYDSITNIYEYRFFNDGLYQSADVLETDLSYDYVPLTSKCLDIINGNVLVLANNKEGYDNIATNVNLGVTYVAPAVVTRMAVDHPLFTTNYFFSGVPLVGDVINYDIDYYEPGSGPPAEPTLNITNTYTVSLGQSGNLNLTINGLSSQIASETGFAVIGTVTVQPDGTILLSFASSPQVVAFGPADVMTISLSVSGLTSSISTYKTNSRYQFGLVYYDDFNRSSYVQTSDNFIVSTESFGSAEGYNPAISWEILHSAPSWAKTYQWVRTEQLTHSKSLFWLATAIAAPAGKNYYELDISSLITYSTTNPDSILNYEYAPGDRCTIHRIGSAWQSAFDVGVVGEEVTSSVHKIQIEKGISLTPGTTDVLIEIYTPKTRSNQPTEQFFYEFGEVYNCSAGTHTVLTGSFTLGDVFFRGRTFNSGVGGRINIEDLNFSDFYVSNFSSNGRVNIFSPQAKQLTLPTDVRYSDTYVPNTNINGLSRFYGDAFETYDRVNGSIQKTTVRDNYLIAFQELKVGYIPILQSIIEDQGSGSSANVAISNKLLNKIRYFAGDFGIGKNPESMARFAGIIYFVDSNRGQVVKLTSGLQPIGTIGMDSYFTSKLTSIKSSPNAKVIGSYDPYNDEYLITFKISTASNAGDATIAFSELINRWTSFYSFIPDSGSYILNQYITHKSGVLYTHNNNSSYGTFYGTNYESYVDLVFNNSPTLIKTFLGFIEQSNTKWTPVTISTSNGQVSQLIDDDLSEKEDVFFASFLRDSSSPGGLLNGDDLKGNWIRLKLSENQRTKSTLFSADVRLIPSYQGIK